MRAGTAAWECLPNLVMTLAALPRTSSSLFFNVSTTAGTTMLASGCACSWSSNSEASACICTLNPDGKAGSVYAGEQPQNSRNSASVSRYDVACARPSK